MSQETSVELLHRGIDAFNRRDLDAFLALHGDDVEVTTLLAELESGPYRGRDGVRAWWESLLTVVPDLRVEADEVRAAGNLTVARLNLSGQGMLSDVPVEAARWVVQEWRGEKCIRWRIFRSEAEALEAAGLRE
jgi:hypothetical protein